MTNFQSAIAHVASTDNHPNLHLCSSAEFPSQLGRENLKYLACVSS
ncbi:hypothetical protein H6F78_17065 [Coleofasciculus sp. FACHB-64]|nr:hypothetical protein [Coleofasciculus sp. FACHB-64]MBD2047282.1 hypothetical protein [Coleofasciculus sp. FACHB-64]